MSVMSIRDRSILSGSRVFDERSKHRKLYVRKSRPPFDPISGLSRSMSEHRLPPCQSVNGTSPRGRLKREQNEVSSSETCWSPPLRVMESPEMERRCNEAWGGGGGGVGIYM